VASNRQAVGAGGLRVHWRPYAKKQFTNLSLPGYKDGINKLKPYTPGDDL